MKKDKKSNVQDNKEQNNSENKRRNILLSTLPFSKKIVEYSRLESWMFSIILIILVWFNKDVSPLGELITVSWVGYNSLKLLYIWLVKHEHTYDKKIELLKVSKSIEEVDEIINEINDEIESEE